MKKFFLILFLSGCVSTQNPTKNNDDNINFSDDLTLEEFKIKLDVYIESSNYPNIDD
jgi:hypothetical protein